MIYVSLVIAIILCLFIHTRRTIQRDIRQHQENIAAARRAETERKGVYL